MHVLPPSAGSLVDQGIAALRSGDTSRAAELLAQALQLDPNHEQAWLWLSGIVTSDAERRFCLERVRAINPQNAAAQQGLTILPATVAPRAPSFARDGDQRTCTFPGCSELVTRSGHTLCYQHWKAVNRPPAQQPAPPSTGAARPASAPQAASQLISATAIGERFAIHSYSVNPLSSLGG